MKVGDNDIIFFLKNCLYFSMSNSERISCQNDPKNSFYWNKRSSWHLANSNQCNRLCLHLFGACFRIIWEWFCWHLFIWWARELSSLCLWRLPVVIPKPSRQNSKWIPVAIHIRPFLHRRLTLPCYLSWYLMLFEVVTA